MTGLCSTWNIQVRVARKRMLVWVLGMGMGGWRVKVGGRMGAVLVRSSSWWVARGWAAAIAAAMLSTARRVTVWNWRDWGIVSARVGQTSVVRPRVRTASRR